MGLDFKEKDMRFWIEHNLNVLMCGEKGTGKTARITELFNEQFGELGKDWLYFSCATLDPWVDFVGVPKERINEDGVAYLDLVRPKHFAYDSVKAIFCDEYNRASDKVLNATLELIQFKRINGKKFNNLRIVWAAINPSTEDDDYTVTKLDPAHKDRFHVHVNVPYFPDKTFFQNKFGENGLVGIEWWNKLEEKTKKLVSPRRLDYALDVFQKDGDIRHVLPEESNVTKLSQMLLSGSIEARLEDIYNKKDKSAGTRFLDVENNYNHTLDTILKKKDYQSFFLPLMSDEKINSIIANKYNILIHVIYEGQTNDKFFKIINNILQANDKSTLSKSITSVINAEDNLKNAYFNTNKEEIKDWGKIERKDAISNLALKKIDSSTFLGHIKKCTGSSDSKLKWDSFYAAYGNIPELMTKQEAQTCILDIENLLIHSQGSTIAKHHIALMNVLNYLFCITCSGSERTGIDLDYLKSQYPVLFRYIGNYQELKNNLIKDERGTSGRPEPAESCPF